jgi:hypothetical protein
MQAKRSRIRCGTTEKSISVVQPAGKTTRNNNASGSGKHNWL